MNDRSQSKNQIEYINAYHRPVMLEETVCGLMVRSDGVYVDATYGGGGHSRRVMEELGEEGRLYGFDQDAEAKVNAIEDARFVFINENFRYLRNFLRMEGVRRIDGLIADLGVSSHQFDEGRRGFSIRIDGPLDLRMNQSEGETAADLVNQLEEGDLSRILSLYGELPNAKAMASAIVKWRNEKAIRTTKELCGAVERHLPRGYENKYLAMLFQALRIEVNGELEALRALLEQGTELLVSGGRMAIITYHSLEDRLVKNYFKAGNFEGEVETDFYGNRKTPMRAVSRKPIVPSEGEVAENNRARSAKLRIAEKRGEEETE